MPILWLLLLRLHAPIIIVVVATHVVVATTQDILGVISPKPSK